MQQEDQQAMLWQRGPAYMDEMTLAATPDATRQTVARQHPSLTAVPQLPSLLLSRPR